MSLVSKVRSIVAGPIVSYLSQKKGISLNHYANPRRQPAIDVIHSIKHDADVMMLSSYEAYQLFMAVKGTQKVRGDVAEVGVYRGGSAKVICEAKASRHLHLFDTFEGIPSVGAEDASRFEVGEYAASLEDVQAYLRDYTNVSFYKGRFPATGEAVRDLAFSMVNLDVDTYESTRDCLEFFYPRPTPGAILMSHDYSDTPGVRHAFDEFFEKRPEPIVELAGSQCLIVKTGAVA